MSRSAAFWRGQAGRKHYPIEAEQNFACRYHDSAFGATAVRVSPGEHYVTSDPDEMLTTILGSCVAACIRDPVIRVGGMNHFMLPEPASDISDVASEGRRYGSVAMERLINDILKRGGQRQRLEVKVFGGANVFGGTVDIGHSNADFVERYLRHEDIPIAAAHLRSVLPRRVHYFPCTGKVMMLELGPDNHTALQRDEAVYRSNLKSKTTAGTAELF